MKGKAFRKTQCTIFDVHINEQRKLHNNGLQIQFQRRDIVREIAKRELIFYYCYQTMPDVN